MLIRQMILNLFFSSDRAADTNQITSSSQIERDISLPLYKDLEIIQILNKAQFSVYLVSSKDNKQNYALKTFPLKNQEPNRFFKNEKRFTFLNHPNIIKVINSEENENIIGKETMSYILMEYAPYGDFFELLKKIKIQDDEKLIRTYFRQLIQGIEHLHMNRVAHSDMKLDNLLLGDRYILKIADFDLSFIEGDSQILSNGTKSYRAPEVIQKRCRDFYAADIYSIGIVLFILKSGGTRPYFENRFMNGIDFYELLCTSQEKFWEEHKLRDEKHFDKRFTPEFRELFEGMTRYRPQERIKIEQIKASKWYQGDIYSEDELIQIMSHYLKA